MVALRCVRPAKSMALRYLLLACALALAVAKSKRNKKLDKRWKKELRRCEQEECALLSPATRHNCANHCVSPKCFDEMYAAEPLEDGEIDAPRRSAFEECLREETRQRKRRAASKDATLEESGANASEAAAQVDWTTFRASPDGEPGMIPALRCDRALSRRGRSLVEREVFARLHPEFKAREWLPPSCPFWPGNDLLLEHEQHKERREGPKGDGEWHCKICGKSFEAEFFLDRHLDHAHTPSPGQEGYKEHAHSMHCPAENCALLWGCFDGPSEPSLEGVGSAYHDDVMRRLQSWFQSHSCSQEQMPKLVQRCRATLLQCVPRARPRDTTLAEPELAVKHDKGFVLPSAAFWEAVIDNEQAGLDSNDTWAYAHSEDPPDAVFGPDAVAHLLSALCDSLTCTNGLLHRSEALGETLFNRIGAARSLQEVQRRTGTSAWRFSAILVVLIAFLAYVTYVCTFGATSFQYAPQVLVTWARLRWKRKHN